MDPTPLPNRLEASIDIAASPLQVWRYLGDFEDVEEWAPALSDAYRTTGPNVGVGSRRIVRYRRLFSLEEVVTEWVEGHRLEYAVFRAPWPLRHFVERWEISPSAVGTRVSAGVSYDVWLGPLGGAVDWLFTRHVLRFEMRAGLRGLKRAAETGQTRQTRKRTQKR